MGSAPIETRYEQCLASMEEEHAIMINSQVL